VESHPGDEDADEDADAGGTMAGTGVNIPSFSFGDSLELKTNHIVLIGHPHDTSVKPVAYSWKAQPSLVELFGLLFKNGRTHVRSGHFNGITNTIFPVD